MVGAVRTNDEALLQLGFDWRRNFMVNEPTIAMREDVLQRAIGAARQELGGVWSLQCLKKQTDTNRIVRP